jgi:hypothetical protein
MPELEWLLLLSQLKGIWMEVNFLKMGEYEYQYDINGVPYGTTIHEMNHNADYLKNKAADADANSNLYYWMRSALKPFSRIDPNTDKLTKYYSKPTE